MNILDEISKSELFDLSPGFSNDSSQLDDDTSLELSNFDLSVKIYEFKKALNIFQFFNKKG